jgi:uncharacterized protein YuzB (UPF0349 family)
LIKSVVIQSKENSEDGSVVELGCVFSCGVLTSDQFVNQNQVSHNRKKTLVVQ